MIWISFRKYDTRWLKCGIDETEHWTRDDMFKLLSTYFQKESARDFSATSRNIMMHDDSKLTWFDELSDTWDGHLPLFRRSQVNR